jgi:periplasmic protein TonB
MGRDLTASLILHAVVLAVTMFAAPLNLKKPQDFTDVIRVGMVSAGDLAPVKIKPAEPAPTPEPPKAVKTQPKEVPVQDPSTKAVKNAKPVDKPKKEPEKPKSKPANNDAETGDQDQPGTPGGKIDVDAPSGSSVSGMGVDNASFNYPYWFTLSYNKLCQNFRIPVVIDGAVSCDVYFQVIKSGRVIEQKVVTPSGIPQFDQACLAAIERSAPFPPLPREFVDEIIGIYVTFTN